MTRIHTPWGESQGSHETAPGITCHHTASHGGVHLSPERFAAFRSRFPWFKTYAGGQWFEEDQDWAAVALAFPECFSDEAIRDAVRTAKASARPFKGQRHPRWEQLVDWLKTEGAALLRRAERWEAEHADEWERSGMSGGFGIPDGFWTVNLCRIRDRERRCCLIPQDEAFNRTFTDAQLAQYADAK